MAGIRKSRGSLMTLRVIIIGIFVLSETSGSHVSEGAATNHHTRRSFDQASPNALHFGEDETSPRTGWKVAHRLVGGHMRLDSTTGSSSTDEDDRRTEKASEESDEATWDDGLVISSAGNGKEKGGSRSDDEDAEKTLSQQIKEGKYGLIQNELYPSRPKRPGIISYSSNPDVPKDNAKNLGGLDEEEIWLAENHVLVLRGGNFPDHEKDPNSAVSTNDWLPIDDYKAPKRQVKIPPNPKVPPPFPVQLTENGPVRVIGVNGSADDSSERDSSRDNDFLPGQGPFFPKNGTVHSQDLTSQENTMKKSIGESEERNGKSGHVPARDAGVIGPFYSSLPPGAVFVMPPSNQTDYDEDDQSIYYPPPYSFYYKQDNSTPVPPGPLVPGIILPPPPDFFSSLEEKKASAKNRSTKYPKRPATTAAPRITPTYYPSRKSSPKPFKLATTTGGSSSKPTVKYTSRGGSFTMKPVSDIKYKPTTLRSSEKSRVRAKTTPLVEVTTPSIEQPTTVVSEFRTSRPNIVVKTTPKSRWVPSVNPVPLVTYYSSSTPSVAHQSVEVTPASVNVITEGKSRSSSHQASYYFYEEANDDTNAVTTSSPSVYYHTTTEAPYYKLSDLPKQPQVQEKPYYGEQIVSTQRTPKHFRLESLKPVQKTPLRYQLDHSAPATNSVTSKVQHELRDSPYYEDVTERPRIQPYYTTPKPTFPEDEYKSKPIYQYSYESADYSKHRGQDYFQPGSQSPSYYNAETQTPEPFDEWQDERNESPQYDYEEGETLPEQNIQPERENDVRDRNRLSYPTTTARPVTTANPQQAYYTRQDDQLLDDVTREYFTNFGKKLRGESVPSTTPIYTGDRLVTDRPELTEVQSYVTNNNDYERVEQRPVYQPPRIRVHYGDQKPYSLEDDTRVNYKDPLPAINPQSEWIPGFNPSQPGNQPLSYRQHHTEIDSRNYDQRNLPEGSFIPESYQGQAPVEGNVPTNFIPIGNSRDRGDFGTTQPLNLQGDIAVNYRDPRPPINPDAEYVDPSILRNNNSPDKASYFAYRLPGDGGHFYFLTPQAISQRQDENGGYLYSRPRGTRFSRQRRRGPRNS